MSTDYTPNAERALEGAVAAARQFNHSYVGTEHILCSILAIPTCEAYRRFERLHIEPEELRLQLESMIGRGEAVRIIGDIPLTARTKKILELAKIDAERGKFAESEKEYAAFLAMWPESPFAEKAMFARGFQLRENLKKDTAALAVLTQFMEKYPKSDLRESVEWLIKDIQSGGKLSEELNRKISEQE